MKPVQTLYRKRLNQIMAARSLTDLSHSAIVFAPHPDDETLGCGGTIIRKKAAGAAVKIVFLTDGSRSHAALIDEPKLKAIRQQEALQAAQVLGVEAADVIFLGFGDGRLRQSMPDAIAQIRDILTANSPTEVFVPYALDPPADHFATYQVVMSALREIVKTTVVPTFLPPFSPTVYAYPIWYWRHWPWTSLIDDSKRGTLDILKASVTSFLGTAMFRDFQHSVYIGAVRSQKRAALAKHASQMERRDGNPNWPILSDVAGGDFLACFFQDYEIFHRPC